MPVIDAQTGKIRQDSDHDAILQILGDRLLTKLGSRLLRPTYGTLIRHANPDQQSTIDTINNALAGYTPVSEIEFRKVADVLNIRLTHD